jgi:hypothetical protein
MAEQFVPFVLAKLAAPSAVRVAGDPSPQNEAFLSLSSSNNQLNPSHGHSLPVGDHPPKITLQRDGERITQITVHCSCGQLIELSCTY